MNEIVNKILNYQTFDVSNYYELLSKYSKKDCHNAFIFIKNKKDKDLNDKYIDAYLMIELDNMNIDDESYFTLASKYGEDNLEKFLLKLLSLKKYLLDKRYKPLYLYIEEANSYFNDNNVQYDLNNDSVKLYLHEIGQFPLLSKDEEVELFTKLNECRKNISIALINKDGYYEIPNIYNIILSITSNNQCIILKKLCSYLNGNDKIVVNKYIELWKKLNKNNSTIDIIPNISDLYLDKVTKFYDEEFLTNQLQYLLNFYQIREKIINSNLRLAVNNSKKFSHQTCVSLDFIDFIQVANMGIIKAVHKYDVNKGYKFSTYSTWWIKQAIARYRADHGNVIRIPVHSYELARKINNAINILTVSNGEIPNNSLIAEYLGIDVKKVDSCRALIEPLNTISIDEPLSDEYDADSIMFKIEDPFASVDDNYEQEELKRIVSLYLELLSPKEKQVLTLRFGMDGKKCMTLDKVGEHMGVTRERVRQIEAKALRKLKRRLSNNSIKQYM